MSYIYGRNPVIEALRHGRQVQKIYIQHGNQSGSIRQIYRMARDLKIPVSNADARKLRQIAGDGNHQGVVALIAPVEIADEHALLDALLNPAGPVTLVFLDRIQDPHNMGAIIRSAEVFGASGVVFSTRENVPVTDTVVKASAGAALNCPLYQTHNLAQLIDRIKAQQDLSFYGAALDGSEALWDVDFSGDCAIIIGSEEKGIRPLLQKKCDHLFQIPQRGKTQSLNASVAAGIVLAERERQRRAEG